LIEINSDSTQIALLCQENQFSDSNSNYGLNLAGPWGLFLKDGRRILEPGLQLLIFKKTMNPANKQFN